MSKIYGADKQTWKRVGAATKYVERIAKQPPNGRERTKLSQSTRNLFVLITGESAVSGYEGYEVRWDGSNWKKVGGGFTWGDSAMFRPILEINGDGLDIPDSSGSIDGVYQVLRLIGTDNKAYWFVDASPDMMGVALADVSGKTVTSGVATTVTITKRDGSTEVASGLVLFGPATDQSFTFPADIEIPAWEYGYDDSGSWTRNWFGYWPYSMTDFDATKNQAYIHEAGAFKWLKMGCD